MTQPLFQSPSRWVLAAGSLFLVPSVVLAQALDERERQRLDVGTIQESQRRADEAARPKKKQVEAPEVSSTMPKVATSLAGLKLTVKGLRIEGDARVSAQALSDVLAPWADKELSFPEFEQAVHAVARYLRANGHPNAEVRISKRMMQEGGQVAVAIQGLSVTPRDYAEAPAVEPRVQVKGFRFSGVTLASEAELQAQVAPWSGKDLSVKEMEQPAEAVAGFLRAKGYPLVQAYLPPQRVDQGVLEIAVREGVVDANAGRNGVVVEGAGRRIRPEVLSEVIAAGAPAGQPLKTADLERALLVANELPGVKVRANLAPGQQPGTTQVEANVEEGPLVSGALWADNYGSRYVGEARLNALLNLNSPTGYGDLLTLSGGVSSGMESGKLSWVLPAGVRGTRLGASYAAMHLDLKQGLTPNHLSGESSILSLFGSHPLLRSTERNLQLAFNFDAKHLENKLEGLDIDIGNDRKIRLGALTASGDAVDRWKGRNTWSTTLSYGSLDLSGNTGYQIVDAATARTEGEFGKLNWSFGRAAPLLGNGSRWSWSLALSGQFASKNLDSAEKFQLGGPGGVRAYPVGEGLGDSGLLSNLELQRSFGATRLGEAAAFAFVDAGHITQYRSPWTNALPGRPNSYGLYGYGLGASLAQSKQAGVRAMVAGKIGDNPNPTAQNTDSDGRSSSVRIWILGNIVF